MSMNFSNKVNSIETRIDRSPWADHEFVRGYSVMVVPFSSGDLLGLRIWLQSDFGPYVSVWHRSPDDDWSIYSDDISLNTTCSRYWNPAIQQASLTDIVVTWTGPNELRVEMEEPHLVWTMRISAPVFLKALNAVSSKLPLWTWKPDLLRRGREWMAERLLGMGDLDFSFTMPSGQNTVIVPEEVFFIEDSDAELDGRSLGGPVRLETNPTIGGVPLPTRPTFVLGEAHMKTTDPEEYRRTREQAQQSVAPPSTATIEAGTE
jgi:hypothetical protein